MKGTARASSLSLTVSPWVLWTGLVAAVLWVVAPAPAQAGDGYRGGHGYYAKRGYYGGHHRGYRGHRHHHHHHHGYSYGPRYSVYLGGWYAPWLPSTLPPYRYHPYPYPYPGETTVIYRDRVYVERPRAETVAPLPRAYWHYCESEEAFYPDVERCPEGWIQVPPRPE